MKTILIAIPTNKYITPETMKSIYDQEIPDGYKTEFQFFYGYQIDQIRNLIANWALRYDYLFAVDSDISFPPDTLKRLLAHGKDIVSGLYIQRKPGLQILELYKNGTNIPYWDIEGKGLVEVDSCGFGCVLVDSKITRAMAYPHFFYRSAIDHANTISEDTYFCMKARELGAKIYADTSILCNHHGDAVFSIPKPLVLPEAEVYKPPKPKTPEDKVAEDRLRDLGNQRLLPKKHVEYLTKLKTQGVHPDVIYDIGACVLHWTKEAQSIWPGSKIVAFEAMDESKAIFDANGVHSVIGVLTDVDGKELTFYQNTYHPIS